MYYNDFILDELKSKGPTLVGFADLSEIDIEIRKGFRYGILIAIAVNPFIISRIPSGPHREYYEEVKTINEKLKKLSLYTEKIIIDRGFKSFSQANIKQDENFITPLPYKTVATRAGIGWIGKSATLVNEKYGNALRLNTVLTDMPFITGIPINDSKCGECKACVINCPANAVKGNNWNDKIERENLLNPKACKEKVIERGLPFNLTWGTCGMCIAVCPYTKRYIKPFVKDN